VRILLLVDDASMIDWMVDNKNDVVKEVVPAVDDHKVVVVAAVVVQVINYRFV
jgi:hypothetical protein